MTAVTSWALLGSYDWNSLLTQDTGFYEAGAFDVSGSDPRPTRIAELLKHLAGGGSATAWVSAHPELAAPGWWRRAGRLTLPPYPWRQELAKAI